MAFAINQGRLYMFIADALIYRLGLSVERGNGTCINRNGVSELLRLINKENNQSWF